MLINRMQSLYNTAHRQSHYIIEIAFHPFDTYNAYPFLYGVGTGFIERLVFINIKSDLADGKVMKHHFRNI